MILRPKKRRLILPDAPERHGTKACDLMGFDDFMMGASDPACAIDQYAANRTFFLRGQGAAGSTPVTDELGNTLTWSGGVTIVTGPSTSYGSAIRVASPGANVYVAGPRGAAFNLPGDFTMRARVNRDSADYVTILAHEAYGGAENGNWVWRLRPDGVEFVGFDAGQTAQQKVEVNSISVPGGWFEAEVSRVSGTLYLHLNGVLVGSGALTKALGSTTSNAPRVGVSTTGTFSSAYYVDVVILKGVGAHTASYTPATLPPC